ncbi:hypothetical protein U1Q18_026026 [Sarracenia purpurea var. burkii]
MHLWPSMRIRDSFKLAYLEKLEWNIQRMNTKKQRQSQSQSRSPTGNQQKLLDDSQRDSAVDSTTHSGGFLVFCRELLMILSCCYCCFCCGAYDDEEEN